MTEEITITLPKLGESIHSATIVQWFKKVGDSVAVDEPLLEVSTDKVNSEIPSPSAGVIKEFLVKVDQEVQVGQPLLVIAAYEAAPEEEKGAKVPADVAPGGGADSLELRGFFSPALLRMAREGGLSLEELERIPATGAEGRLTKKDLEIYIANKAAGAECSGRKRIKMSGMRKVIAETISRSYREVPHAALVCTVDLGEALAFVEEHKAPFLAKEGCKLTVTSLVLFAFARALQEHPYLNAEVEGGDTIVIKSAINIGVAVSVKDGLLVPVIKRCQEKGLLEIAKDLARLSQSARDGTLKPEEVREGTATLSNFGMSGMSAGFPIIRYPEVAILGMAAIEKRVVVLDKDQTAIRPMVNFTLSFDHRVVDGMYGCSFLSKFKNLLESRSTFTL